MIALILGRQQPPWSDLFSVPLLCFDFLAKMQQLEREST
jgi:hypothetical protein